MPAADQPPRPSRRKHWRWALIAWGALALILVMAALGSQIEPDDTEAAPTSTTVPRTTLPPTTTLSYEQCDQWAREEAAAGDAMNAYMGAAQEQLLFGNFEEAQFWWGMAAFEAEMRDMNGWSAECGHWDPAGTAEVMAAHEEAMDAWAYAQRVCREELLDVGFIC